jgi:hypothetical protein
VSALADCGERGEEGEEAVEEAEASCCGSGGWEAGDLLPLRCAGEDEDEEKAGWAAAPMKLGCGGDEDSMLSMSWCERFCSGWMVPSSSSSASLPTSGAEAGDVSFTLRIRCSLSAIWAAAQQQQQWQRQQKAVSARSAVSHRSECSALHPLTMTTTAKLSGRRRRKKQKEDGEKNRKKKAGLAGDAEAKEQREEEE